MRFKGTISLEYDMEGKDENEARMNLETELTRGNEFPETIFWDNLEVEEVKE